MLMPDYACYWLLSRFGRLQIEADARGTSGSMVKVSQGHIRNWLICHPPLPEQIEIVASIQTKCERLDAVTTRIGTAVDRLLEYRTALISAAVTGKVDVREEV